LRAVLAGESDLHGVRARRLSRGIALSGEVASAASVDRALRLAAGALPEGVPIENDLRIAAPRQVNLEVQIAEVHRSVTEDLGVNWEVFRVRGNEAFGIRIGRTPSVDDGRLAPTYIDGQISPSLFFGRATENTRIGAMIDALATAGLANVLARPNVTAVSGESASFFSGGERPIPAGFDRDTNTILYEYKKVGVVLDFVPTVVDTGRIVLTVRPEVSEPDTSQPLVIGPVSLPVINVRRAETTVEVGDGESIVIAGLFRNQSSTTEAGLPGLKDVPLLGLLFGTTSIRSNELELIVVVTARLVEPQATPDETNARAATLQSKGYHY
jgi:pilus assembly protein CpaC